MAENFTIAYTSRDPSTSGIQKRTVNDRCRNLYPGAAYLMALVTHGKVNKGEVTQSPGMIGKRSCSHRRYEYFTWTPWVTTFTISAVDGAKLTLNSVTGVLLRRTLLNTRTLDVGRVSALNPDGDNALEITSTAISSSFTCLAGDTLIMMAPAYQEASTSPALYMNTEDQHYNTMQIPRYPWRISKSAKSSDNYIFGKNYFDALGKRTMTAGNLLIEHSFFFGERASVSTTDLTTDSTLSESYSSMRGFATMAQKSFDAGGAMSPEKWITELPLALSDTISSGQKVVGFTGKRISGDMQMWPHDKYMITSSGTLEKYGIKSKVFMTAGPEIEIIEHPLFDNTGLTDKMFIMVPDDALYIFREGRDIHVESKETQPNDADYYEHIVTGELTCAELTGGLHCCMVSNWF